MITNKLCLPLSIFNISKRFLSCVNTNNNKTINNTITINKKGVRMIKTLLWNNYYFKLNKHDIISKDLIKSAVSKFWKDLSNELTRMKGLKAVFSASDILADKHLIILFRIKTEDDLILTLGNLQKLSFDDMDYYINYIFDVISLKTEDYHSKVIKEIIFSYGVRDGNVDKHIQLKQLSKNTLYQIYLKYKLPITFEPFKYGKILYHDINNSTFIVQIGQLTQAIIKQVNNYNHVEIMKNGEMIISYKDILNDNNGFIREIGNNKFYYDNENKLYLTITKKAERYIKTKSCSNRVSNKFITLDIETKLINNNHIPYLISYFDGKISKSFFISDYKSPIEMIQDCILSLCRSKYNRYKIYIHNLANFDGIFLLNALADIGELNVLMNKEKLISFDFHFRPSLLNKSEIVLYFRDSYQILISSLKNLGNSFKVNSLKTIFPYKFINENNLDYVGYVPPFNYFDNITSDEYFNYLSVFKGNWNLKEEAIKYCQQDCKSLYEIIFKFNKLYYDNFKININDHVTLSSHCFRIYQSHFMKKETICMIYGNDYENIRKSYTGGATDMYIPFNNQIDNELVYGYDVNSLYPFIMSKFKMPVRNMQYFEGDIRAKEPNAFGFFFCRIETPKYLEHPILQTHCLTNSGLKTISPLGSYEDLIFSPEMDNAIKHGYKFEILNGYTFDGEVIFKDYVDTLYNFRLNYPKSDPMNLIAKLFLNSLYGKFGMSDKFDEIKVITEKEFNSLTNLNKMSITDVIKLSKKFLIKFKNIDNDIELDNKNFNINIAIASAITSYARIFMSQFKNNSDLKLFYTDTDSIYTNLNPDLMNKLYPGIVNPKELGKLKLENVSKKAIFLSPKCYGLLDLDNNFKYKVKGLSNKVNLTINDFETLLNKYSYITSKHIKTFKSIELGIINVLNQIYTLKITDNKRKLIFNDDNKLIGTMPYTISSNKFISKK